MGFVGPCRKLCCEYKNDRVFANGGVVLKRKGKLKMKLHRLQRIIPGGQGLKPDQLMVHTADYILHLRLQLCVLEALLKLHDT
ncbi:hypothetical protein L484_004928 [Morus notabilis]|uniref:BHLH domain-containing protein n=1 Tax=Morus notabilis TaxID=981085 RepID=W9S869_9ROSA|nr:hypothetical protein L484_004928 [Morus notabilis]